MPPLSPDERAAFIAWLAREYGADVATQSVQSGADLTEQYRSWVEQGRPIYTGDEPPWEPPPPPTAEEQQADIDARVREVLAALGRGEEVSYEGNEDLVDALLAANVELISSDVVGGLPEADWVFQTIVEEPPSGLDIDAALRALFSQWDIYEASREGVSFFQTADGSQTWDTAEEVVAYLQSQGIRMPWEGGEEPLAEPSIPPHWTFDETSGYYTDPETGNQYWVDPITNQPTLVIQGEPEDPLEGLTWVAPDLYRNYDGNFFRENGASVPGEIGNAEMSAYMEQLSPEEQDELTAYQEENIRIQDERLELERQRMAQAGEETPLERAQRIAFEAQQFAGAENWITRWQMEELQREDENKQKRRAAHQRASEMMQAASELPFGSEERLQAEMATERAWDALANMRPFEPAGPPPAPAFPEFQELTGFAPGEQIAPGFTTLASGQTMSALSPSQMGGITGFVDFSAGQVPGAWASAEDYWAEALGMLPTSVPRGTVRWSPSPYSV